MSSLINVRRLGLAAVLLSAPCAVVAQNFVERNPPPAAPRGDKGALVFDAKSAEGSDDDTPLGVDLAGVMLIGPRQAVSASPGKGVVLGDIGANAPHATLNEALAPFLGRPLSRKRIAELEAAVAKAYRDTDRPFVSVTLPPQDATHGVVTLRVIEFRLGKIGARDAAGAAPEKAAALATDVRVRAGESIDAAALSEDLDWLNRNPFRRVQGIFAPGDELGGSDLTLSLSETKPWQIFAGIGNTGTKSTGETRLFVGGAALVPFLGDTLVSYQYTTSDDIGGERPKYESHSARLTIPTAARQAVEIAGNYVATRQEQPLIPGVTLRTDNDTYEIPVQYRSAVSNLLPGVHAGDFILGAEGKHTERRVAFAGTTLGEGEANLLQFVGGWSWTPTDAYGDTAIDFRVKGNPSGILADSGDAAWSNFTGGRMTSASYAFGTLSVRRTTDLTEGLSWVAYLDGILAGSALPDTELMAPGGFYGVRGYLLDDGTFDRGLSLRNELHLPGTDVFGDDLLSPFVFVDYGYGKGVNTAASVNLVSTGAGMDYRWSSHLSAGAALGFAMRDAAVSKAGDARFVIRVTVSY